MVVQWSRGRASVEPMAGFVARTPNPWDFAADPPAIPHEERLESRQKELEKMTFLGCCCPRILEEI